VLAHQVVQLFPPEDTPMNPQVKLREAQYFLRQMERPDIQADSNVFGYHFSAFLSASRSSLQHLWEKAKLADKKDWFNTRQSECEWYGAFKDLRDVNIHWEDMRPGLSFTTICEDGEMKVGTGPVVPAKWRYAVSSNRGLRPIYLDTVEYMADGKRHLMGHRYRVMVCTDDDTSEKCFGMRRRGKDGWQLDYEDDKVKDADLIDCSTAYLNEIRGMIDRAIAEGILSSEPDRTDAEENTREQFVPFRGDIFEEIRRIDKERGAIMDSFLPVQFHVFSEEPPPDGGSGNTESD